MSKSPAFQFYPQDFLADLNVKLMDPEAVGGYVLLLCHDWVEDGLPDDDKALAILSNLRERWPEYSEQVLKCFVNIKGKLFNPRLLEERKKQAENRKKKSAAGKASGKSRRNNDITVRTDEEQKANTCSTSVDDVYEQKRTLQPPPSPSTSTSLPPPDDGDSEVDENITDEVVVGDVVFSFEKFAGRFPVIKARAIHVDLLCSWLSGISNGVDVAGYLACLIDACADESVKVPMRVVNTRVKVGGVNPATLKSVRDFLNPPEEKKVITISPEEIQEMRDERDRKDRFEAEIEKIMESEKCSYMKAIKIFNERQRKEKQG